MRKNHNMKKSLSFKDASKVQDDLKALLDDPAYFVFAVWGSFLTSVTTRR
jgi:HKD family nuclease